MQDKSIQISIIIVNYNTGKVLLECVDSVFKFENEIEFEIIIVDNYSNDNSKEIIKEISAKYKNVKTIFHDSKKSFSESNNAGFEISNGEYILIMNPDIIFTEQLLAKMIDDINSNAKYGAVCPMLLGTDKKFQSRYFQRYPSVLQFIFFYSVLAKMFMRFHGLTYKYLHMDPKKFREDTLEKVDQIPCAFFFTKRNIFSEAGKMDDRYELFFEDVDLSYQISRKHELAVDTSVNVTHLGGESFRMSDDYWLYGRFMISMIIFSRKNYGWFNCFSLKYLSILNSLFVLSAEKIKGAFGKEDDYRLRKHKYFLNELGKTKI